MYPRISDLFQDLFGFSFPLPLYSFGLMVALAILTATWLTRIELDRKYAAGEMPGVRVKETAKGRERMVTASPSVLAWTMMMLAGFFGVLGSKLFHIFDFWDTFVQDPLGMFFSASGLTFYGGLICAGLAIAYYAKRQGIHVPRLADAIAPGLILAYGIGRIGCYLSGDGDWGVCSSLADKPAWIPGFLWSETFPRAHVGMDPVLFNAQVRGEVCPIASPDGVYPTMLYEFALAALIAGGLWMLRKHPFKAGWLFSLYLVFSGLERFVIEFIRVNPLGPLGLSQSQWISIGLIVGGLVGLALTTRRTAAPPSGAAPTAPVAA
jgi:phosphatidylglycerol:prolipoprotein diacylglycerol transferase